MTELQTMLRQGKLREIAAAGDPIDPMDWLVKAQALIRLGRVNEAMAALDKLEPANPEQLARAVTATAEVFQSSGRHMEIGDLFEQGPDHDSLAGEPRARYLWRKGEYLQMLGDHETAYETLIEALESARGCDLLDIEFCALETCSDAAMSSSLDSESEEMADDAMALTQRLLKESNDPQTLLRAGEFTAYRGDSEDSAEYFRRALSIAQSSQSLWDEAHVLLGLGRYHEFMVEEEEALMNTRRAMDAFREMGALPALLTAVDQYATQLANLGRLGEALKELDKVVESSAAQDDAYTLLNILGKCCQLCFEARDYEQGLDYLVRLIEESAARELKPPFVLGLLREAYRKAPSELVREKLGDGSEDEFEL